jgi:hypothetical protein
MAETESSLLFEQMLKARLAQIELTRQTMQITQASRFDGLKDLSDALMLQRIRG